MCCGNKRAQLRTTTPTRPRSSAIYAGGGAVQQQSHVYFICAGSTGMTVRGPVSGKMYHFARPGVRVAVDPRDRILLASIRGLQQVG